METTEINNLLRNSGVRYLLQRVRSELNNTRAGKPHVFAKVISYDGKTTLFGQNKPIDNDEYFLQLLINEQAIDNINFELRNKNNDYIDDLLLSPKEFNHPYILVSFDVTNAQYLSDLCDTAGDIFVLNPYSLEIQKNIVLSAINVLKARINNENVTLSWDDFTNPEDARRIQMIKTLRDLHKDRHISLASLDYDLLQMVDKGRIKFSANVLCETSPVSLSKDILNFKSLSLDTTKEIVFYGKLNKWMGFDKRDGRKLLFEVLQAFIKKEISNKALTDSEIFQIIGHRGRMPKKLQAEQLDKVTETVHHLNDKFQNNKFIIRDKKAGCYRLIP